LLLSEEVESKKLPREVGEDKQQTSHAPSESNSPSKQGLTDGELSKLINADRTMLYRWRKGGQPQRPSKRYKEVMKDWQFKGDRWYRRS
jgi:hypothetical protein